MQMTFNEYDNLVENFKKISFIPTWPTYEQIDTFKQNPPKWLLYACFVLEMAEQPKEKKEMYSKSNLTTFVNENLELIND